MGVPASADPTRAADNGVEVAANALGILVSKYVSLDVPVGRRPRHGVLFLVFARSVKES